MVALETPIALRPSPTATVAGLRPIGPVAGVSAGGDASVMVSAPVSGDRQIVTSSMSPTNGSSQLLR